LPSITEINRTVKYSEPTEWYNVVIKYHQILDNKISNKSHLFELNNARVQG